MKWFAEQRHLAIERCLWWGVNRINALKPASVLDVGCGDGSLLRRVSVPFQFHGIEAAGELADKARKLGPVSGCDLNGKWPFPDDQFDLVHCSQVIEHVHNTRQFIREARRVLKPGGRAVITSENLTGLLNTLAMMLGYTPFSLQSCCGVYCGNPLGLHHQETIPWSGEMSDPTMSGRSGHNRVLGVRQARELFIIDGFQNVRVTSMGILPLPDWLSRILEPVWTTRGHYLLIEATKP